MNKRICIAIIVALEVLATAITIFLSMEIREKNNLIDSLNNEITFQIEQATGLQSELGVLKDEYDVTVIEKSELDAEVTVKEAEIEAKTVEVASAQASSNANAAEASRQQGIAWNAQTERDAIQVERDALQVERDQLEYDKGTMSTAAFYFATASSEFSSAMTYMSQAAAALIEDD